MTTKRIKSPAERPCSSDPYRQDVPSGIWDVTEYDKLGRYDRDTPYQPSNLFLCHLFDRDGERRICAGWAGCHSMADSLALRLAVRDGRISTETYDAVLAYQSPEPLFESGAEAARHGRRDLEHPGPEAIDALTKIRRARPDIDDSPFH